MLFLKVSSDGSLPQQGVSAPSRVAAVGPYIQSFTMPRISSRPELVVKPALPDGSLAMQVADGPMKVQTLPNMRSGAASQTKGKDISESFPSSVPPCPHYYFSQVCIFTKFVSLSLVLV